MGDSDRAVSGHGVVGWGVGSGGVLGLGPMVLGLGATTGSQPQGQSAGRAAPSASTALSHVSQQRESGRTGDGSHVQPRVLIICCGCRDQESWVGLC